MPKKPNHVCKVCGTEYYYCPSCSGAKVSDKYKTMFCSENCRDIFKICSAFNMKNIDKEEAKKSLSSLDLSKRAQFSKQIQIDIDNIMKEDIVEPVETNYISVDLEVHEDEVVSEQEQPAKKYKRAKKIVENSIDNAIIPD